jgi:FAD:protein FMN transferase
LIEYLLPPSAGDDRPTVTPPANKTPLNTGAVYSHPFFAMGTRCALHICAATDAGAATAFAAALAEVERIERKYSRYDRRSFVSAINERAAAGQSITVDDETAALLDYAYACHAKSDGLFDISAGILRQCWNFSSGQLPDVASVRALLPRIGLTKIEWHRPKLHFRASGMEIDLGGIGKEYAVDRVASVLGDLGVTRGLIDLGGDMVVLGPHPDGQPWAIRLRHPSRVDEPLATATVRRGALATSGDYERCIEIAGRRYSHILDPRTGWPVEGLSSVSVLADSCMVAGSIATIAMLKGCDGAAWLNSLGVAHYWVKGDGRQGGTLPAVFSARLMPQC